MKFKALKPSFFLPLPGYNANNRWGGTIPTIEDNLTFPDVHYLGANPNIRVETVVD